MFEEVREQVLYYCRLDILMSNKLKLNYVFEQFLASFLVYINIHLLLCNLPANVHFIL